MTSREKLPFILIASILLLALYLRLMVVAGSQVGSPLMRDAGQYFSYAYNLKYHGIYAATETWHSGATPIVDDIRNPGYSLFLIPLIDEQVSTATLYPITVIQAIISTFTVALVFFLVRRVFNFYTAAGSALLTTLSPHLMNANVYILTESIAAFSLVLFLFVSARSTTHTRFSQSFSFQDSSKCFSQFRQISFLPWLFMGMAVALGTLIRPTLQWFLLPLLGIVYALPEQNRPRPWQRIVWLLLGFIVLMLPWWIRNILQFSEMSNSTLMINTLHHGMYPNFTFEGHPESFGFLYRFDPRSQQIVASIGSVINEIIRRFMVAPGEHLYWYLIGKPLMFWKWRNDAAGAGDVFIYPMLRTPFVSNSLLYATHEVMRFLHIPLVVIGMVSSLVAWFPVAKRRVQNQEQFWFWRIISALLLYFVVLHMIGAPFPRYNIPVLPVVYIQVNMSIFFIANFFRYPRFYNAANP